ncbi:uncharacterized protein LOC127262896 [Andrographis paniculata]|uniref:uncharacterized protein LOC127262896 n=1 Tax=Andrographis paniculata TaxID=175694 RepID=UPI0021E79848|nr:uncharacterized protein LOC127262896 [Andrographis paniculata]
MQDGGGGECAGDANAGPAKRMRRPSVRLHQPYYENPGHRKLQRQWKAMKKDAAEGGKKGRAAVRTAQSKRKKNEGASESSKGEMAEGLNSDDDVAIGNWKSFNAANRDRDFKRKRVRPSSKPRGNDEDAEIGRIPASSDGGSAADGVRKEGGDEILGANGIDSNLIVENSEPSSPRCSFGNGGTGDRKNDGNDVGMNWRSMKQCKLMMNCRNSNEMRIRNGVSDEDRDGVRVWLNQLGLGKYFPLFKVHEVDAEVLPFLTLEDLKDMGVSAVGSRRKMYASIEKLGKGFE